MPQCCVEDSITGKEMCEAVQLELVRRRAYMVEHGIQKLEHATTIPLPGGSFAAAAARSMVGRYGTQPMIDCEESSGDAMGNM